MQGVDDSLVLCIRNLHSLATLSRCPAGTDASNPLLAKYLELQGIVKEDPGDFNTWTQLISTADKLVRSDASRKVAGKRGRADTTLRIVLVHHSVLF